MSAKENCSGLLHVTTFILGIIILFSTSDLISGMIPPGSDKLNISFQDTTEHLITKVKLKNGKIKEGTIRESLVLKGETDHEKVDSVIEYRTAYFLISGPSTVSIGLNGIQSAPGRAFYHIVATTKNKAADDNEVLDAAFKFIKRSPFSLSVHPLKGGDLFAVNIVLVPEESKAKNLHLDIIKDFHGDIGLRTVEALDKQETEIEKTFQSEVRKNKKANLKWKCQFLGTVDLREEEVQMTQILNLTTPKGKIAIPLKQINTIK